MLYAILIYVAEDTVAALTKAEEEAHIAKHLLVREKLAAKGKLGPAVRLMPTSTAVQLRTAGVPVVVDGPFAETKEQLLGFYVIDCQSQEEAIETARSLPSLGTVFEIRRINLYFPGSDVKAQTVAPE